MRYLECICLAKNFHLLQVASTVFFPALNHKQNKKTTNILSTTNKPLAAPPAACRQNAATAPQTPLTLTVCPLGHTIF